MRRERDLTTGNITTSLWLFALPLMLGNVMQKLYNLVDTWVVGRYIGDTALAAVGSSYTILTFLLLSVCAWAAVPFCPWHTAGAICPPCETAFFSPAARSACCLSV